MGDGFKANAFAKVQKVLAGWPTKITSSKDLKGVAGVGKGSAAKASRGVFLQGSGVKRGEIRFGQGDS